MAKSRTDVESVVKLVINGEQAKTSAKEITDSLRKYQTELKNLKQADNPQLYQQKAAAVRALKNVLAAAREEMEGTTKASKDFATSWLEISKGVIGANIFERITSGIANAIPAIKEAYAETEKFRAILTNAFKGNEEAAGRSLQMLQNFAAKTPFQLAEATDGYIKLVNRGLKPTQSELIKMGDLTASQGKGLDQYIEALLDAQTGEFERLKEFGIRASKNGDSVSLSFKGITKEVKNSSTAITQALLDFGEMDGVRGSMEAVSKTIVGLGSNIEDTWSQIYTKLGQKSEGFIYGLYSTYANVLEYVNERILGTQTAADALTDKWITQGETVRDLEKNMNPLLSRYEELKSKANLNKIEQNELQTIISRIAEIVPSAVTQFDKYGKALGINTTQAREFIAVQKEILKYQNKEAIESTNDEIDKLTRQQAKYQKLLKDRTKVDYAPGMWYGAGSTIRQLTDEEIKETAKQLNNLSNAIDQKKRLLKGLTGGMFDEVKKIKEEANKVDSTSDAEKKRQEAEDEARRKRAEAAKEAEKERKKAIKDREKELEDLKKAGEQLAKTQQLSEMSGLDKSLQEIANKFDPLIARAIKAKDAIRQALFEGLKEDATNAAVKTDKREKAAQGKEADKMSYELDRDYIDSDYAGFADDINSRFANGEIDENKKNEWLANLEEERLIAQLTLAQSYGEKGYEYEQALLQRKIDLRQKDVENQKTLKEAQEQIEASRNQLIMEGADVLKSVLNKRSLLYKAAVVAEKAAAIAEVVRNTQAEISGYFRQYALIPGGFAKATILSAIAVARSGVAIAKIGKSGIDEMKGDNSGNSNNSNNSSRPTYALGGIPDGPSHANGGIKLVSGLTGQVLGEMEGGEPIISKEVYARNPELIDSLLYAGKRRSNASLSLSLASVSEGERASRFGGSSISTADTAALGSGSSNYYNLDNSDLLSIISDLSNKFDDFAKKPWEFPMRTFYDEDDKNKRIRTDATA